MNVQQKEKGFTIIEVVLVLAIAGLIFLMVFIALPALQRSQRDTQRKNDMSRLETAVTNYSSNNRGSLPSNWNSFVTNYLTTAGDSFVDPSGAPTSGDGANSTTYVLKSDTTASLAKSFTDGQNTIYYSVGYVCDTTDSSSIVTASARKVAFRMTLEGGGIDCLNN
jgi:prepilin-type N-terminal cleavage/methylation domain-containing protein